MIDLAELKLDEQAAEPLYRQIADRIRRLVATGRLQPGDHLPPVREMARSLGVNQNTVVKAYAELEQEGVIFSRRGGGTIVARGPDDPVLTAARQRRLAGIISDDIVKVFSLGYSPEEVEAAFYTQLARWREEREMAARPGKTIQEKRPEKAVLIVGSHDLALDILVELTKRNFPQVEINVTNAGSLGGLIALQEGRAHVAGIHLLDEETGEYNYPYVRRILPGREIAVVHLAGRIQGLMYRRGNPKSIRGLLDLKRPDIVFVNRQRGAGTRVLLDIQMRQLGIRPEEVKGYDRELDTHLAVGAAVGRGEADVALGIEAAARSCDLDFLPLFRERYDLVMMKQVYQDPMMGPLLETLGSREFREIVDRVGGYDTSRTGSVTVI